MNRVRCTFAATVVGVSFVSALLIAQTPAAPPMTSVLAGKKLTPRFAARRKSILRRP